MQTKCRAIYKRDQVVELGSANKQLQLSGPRVGPEPTTSRFQVQRPDHSAKLTPKVCPGAEFGSPTLPCLRFVDIVDFQI